MNPVDLKSRLTANGANLFGWILATLVMSQRYCGFFVLLVLPFVVVYHAIRLMTGFRQFERRDSFLISAIALAIIGAVHFYRAEALRHAGNQAVESIQTYRDSHGGEFPSTKENLGFVNGTHDGVNYGAGVTPIVWYMTTFEPFDSWVYRFDTGAWEFHPD